jgi:dynactin complex subunit
MCRCEVQLKDGGRHRGTIAYVGPTEFQDGMWVGATLDEPFGKHDGM